MKQAAEAEFRAFVHNRGPSLYQSAYLLTGAHDAAADLTHSALARVAGQWRRLAGTDPDSRTRRIMYDRHLRAKRLRSWIGTITARRSPLSTDADRPSTTTTARPPLLLALAHLPVRQRVLVLLRHHENLPDHEVAALLDLPVPVVHRETDRASHALRTPPPHPADADRPDRTQPRSEPEHPSEPERRSDPEPPLGARLAGAAQVDPPEGLATAALLRLRERRRLATMATAGGLAVVVLLQTAAAHRIQTVTPAHGALAATPGRYVLSELCTTEHDLTACRTLDPRSGRYVLESGSGSTGIRSRLASPDGTRTLVGRSDASYVVVDRDHLLDEEAPSNPRFVPGPKMLSWSWSPDGRSVLFLDFSNQPEPLHRFRVLDAATGRLGEPVSLRGGPHPISLPPVWDPSGASLWYGLRSNDGTGFRLTNFDLSGQPTGRTITVPIEPSDALRLTGSGDASRDGRYLLYAAWPIHVVDLKAGRLQQWGPPEPADSRVRDLQIIGWYDDSHLLGLRTDTEQAGLAVIDFDGRVVGELAAPVFPGRRVGVGVLSAAAYPPGIGLRF